MKKILIVLILFFSSFWSVIFSSEKVQIFATVGDLAPSPRIISVQPSSDPVFVQAGTLQYFTIEYEISEEYLDDETIDNIYYSITSADWAVNPSFWTIESSWSINFYYNAPSDTGFRSEEITFTMLQSSDDWDSIVSHNIAVYVF